VTPLHHQVSGEGSPVVLLHSGATDFRQWDPQWEPLAACHQVVRYDRRGWGRSPVPASGEAPYSDAGDVVDLLDELGIERATLVGSSAGGIVAQQVASAWPHRVERLVLICSPAEDTEPTASVLSFAEREDAYLERGAVADAVELNVETWLGPEASDETRDLVREMQRNAFEVQLAAGDDMPREPGPAVDLTRATMPAQVISGGQDLDYFAHSAERLVQLLPDAQHTVLPWSGHLPNLERPDEVSALLLDVL
jgi:3-oxoadipate enol-lactonase